MSYMNDKFSIIIPTMWRYDNFPNFLKELVSHDLVGEIIIIDNDSNNRPYDIITNDKIIFHDFGENIFVNPAWNYGVAVSKYNKICILNDDLEFDIKLFDKIFNEITPDNGIYGIITYESIKNGPINFKKYEVNVDFIGGFGQLMFLHKDNWVPIIDGLNVYYGDDYIINIHLLKNKPVYTISNMEYYSPGGVTSSIFGGDQVSDSESIIYYKWYYKSFNICYDFEKEYKEYKHITSYINEHLELLRELAQQCNSVTHFGVESGISSRAFLSENIKLRSYDIKFNNDVYDLFRYGKCLGKDIEYIIADVLNIEIEETDLLFIDSLHTYEQLSMELSKHANKVNKYIVFHDTFTFGLYGELENTLGLLPAIIEFMIANPEWKFSYHSVNNNGLTVLERISVNNKEPIDKLRIKYNR